MDDDEGFEIFTTWENLVSNYTGLNFIEVADLNYLDYLIYRRDAFIHRLNQSEKGQEYLKNAFRLQKTKPDKQKLRDKFGKGGIKNGKK